MRDTDRSGIQVVRKDEKEPRITAFIERHLQLREASGAREPTEYLLLARSPESPVCKALSALAPILADRKISLRVVLTAIDSGAFQGDMTASAALLQAATIRVLSDSRLYEAHEQLLLDNETCWIGDCMRREPAKRDAYERYAFLSIATARAAMITFSHFWRLGSPTIMISGGPSSLGLKSSQDPSVFSPAIPGPDNPNPSAATRH
jgi:hypothetical protein